MSFVCDNCSATISVQMWGSLGSWKDDSCNPFIEMETLCIECLLNKFNAIIDTMDVPEMRKKDYRWLQRNMSIRNGKHKDIDQANFYLKAIIRKLS